MPTPKRLPTSSRDRPPPPRKPRAALRPGTPAAGGGGASNVDASVTIWADVATNALIITAPPKIMESLMGVIDKLDIRRAQVQVEAIIVEVDVNKSSNLGVQWLLFGQGTAPFPPASINLPGARHQHRRSGGRGLGRRQAHDRDDRSWRHRHAHHQQFHGRHRRHGRDRPGRQQRRELCGADSGAAQRRQQQHHFHALIDHHEQRRGRGEGHAGDPVDHRFLHQYHPEHHGNTSPFQTIQREEVGTILKVTPHINEGNSVQLKIEQEDSSPGAKLTDSADISTNKRSIKTTVLIEDGGIIVLGGLMSDTVSESEDRVPGTRRHSRSSAICSSRAAVRGRRRTWWCSYGPRIMRDAETTESTSEQKYNDVRRMQQGITDGHITLLPGQKQPVVPVDSRRDRDCRRRRRRPTPTRREPRLNSADRPLPLTRCRSRRRDPRPRPPPSIPPP